MPLKVHRCASCEVDIELLLPKEEGALHVCGEPLVALGPGANLIAHTPNRWGDPLGGVNGHYDRGLGARYSNTMERERIMRQRGVVHESEVSNKHFLEDNYERKVAEKAKHDAFAAKMEASSKKFEGDRFQAERALEDAMPAEAILRGEFDNV